MNKNLKLESIKNILHLNLHWEQIQRVPNKKRKTKKEIKKLVYYKNCILEVLSKEINHKIFIFKQIPRTQLIP